MGVGVMRVGIGTGSRYWVLVIGIGSRSYIAMLCEALCASYGDISIVIPATLLRLLSPLLLLERHGDGVAGNASVDVCGMRSWGMYKPCAGAPEADPEPVNRIY